MLTLLASERASDGGSSAIGERLWRRWNQAITWFRHTAPDGHWSGLATLGDAVYVLHAFGKKSGKTAKPDIDIAKTRYRQLMETNR